MTTTVEDKYRFNERGAQRNWLH